MQDNFNTVPKSKLSLALAYIVATAVIVGLTVYLIMDNKLRQYQAEVKDLKQKNDELTEKIQQLEILSLIDQGTGKNLVEDTSRTLKETRDVQRITDLATLQSLFGLYLATESNPKLAPVGLCADEKDKTIFISLTSTKNLPAPPAGWKWRSSSSPKNTDGTGWLPIDFTKMPGGSPVVFLPIDPKESAEQGYFYAYLCEKRSLSYLFLGNMESDKFQRSETQDGGNLTRVYEVGTVKLSPSDFGAFK